MTKAELLADPTSCLNRSRDDEPVFVLCARDVVAPEIVEAWADAAARAGSNSSKTRHAMIDAEDMRRWQAAHADRVKVPD
jgi:hypothetical protein